MAKSNLRSITLVIYKLNPTTTSPTSCTFIFSSVFLTSLPIRIIHSLSSFVTDTSSGGEAGLGGLSVFANCWYLSDRSPKSILAIEIDFAFNSLILIVFLFVRAGCMFSCTPSCAQRFVLKILLHVWNLLSSGWAPVDALSCLSALL